ncbi:MAG: hypothetical protein SV201_01035 [Pseudomonadota bacterium]|nr:hypothetical protein [Pseudomonadota bacterium]
MEQSEVKLLDAYLIYPQWAGLFVVGGFLILLIVGVTANYLFGLTAKDSVVFAVEALFSGLVVDVILRKTIRRRLVVAPKLKIPNLIVWPIICVIWLAFVA